MSKPKQSGVDSKRTTDTDRASRTSSGKTRRFGGKSIGGIAIVALVGLYAVAQPIVNERFGWDLPEVRQGADGQIAVVNADPPTKSKSSQSSQKDSKESKSDDKPGTSEKARGPLADRMRPSGPTDQRQSSTAQSSTAQSKSVTDQPTATAADRNGDDLRYGLLREVGTDRFMSPAGLLYTPGSAEGHRLEHLRRHTKDQPSRPGSHGVFDGGMEGALKTIDRAYERAKKGQKTTKRVDDGRTILTVDMGGRVGFVGGRDGGRRRKPMARRVRLILEGTRVITAYPM